jgi:hypothetical protein
MRIPWLVTLCAAVIASATGCKTKRLIAKEKEATDAEQHLSAQQAELAKRQAERKDLLAKREVALAASHTARANYNQVRAAAAYISTVAPKDVRLDAPMAAARLGESVQAALAHNDAHELQTLITDATRPSWPCAPSAASDDSQAGSGDSNDNGNGSGNAGSSPCGPCDAQPFEDACTNVDKNTTLSLHWECQSIQKAAGSVPNTVFCTAEAEYPASQGSFASSASEQGLDTFRNLVRVAYLYEGRIHVADYPEPSVEQYSPTNVEGLARCTEMTQENSCRHDCDVNFDRYQDPCACDTGDFDQDCRGDGPTDESDEPANVREAREEAAAAERRAEEARAEEERADKEVRYQECLSNCSPNTPDGSDKGYEDEAAKEANPPPPEPDRIEITTKLESQPAPGVFLVQYDRNYYKGQTWLDVTTSTAVLEDETLTNLSANKKPPTAGPDDVDLHELHFWNELCDGRAKALKKGKRDSGWSASFGNDEACFNNGSAWVNVPNWGKSLVGISLTGGLVGLSFTPKDGETVRKVNNDELCAIIKAGKYPQAFVDECNKPPPQKPAPKTPTAPTVAPTAPTSSTAPTAATAPTASTAPSAPTTPSSGGAK